MRSFDNNGFENKFNTEKDAPLASDFITRRKSAPQTNTNNVNENKAEDKPTSEKALSVSENEKAVAEQIPEMKVISIKNNRKENVNPVFTERKNIFVTDNVLEKKKKKLPLRTVALLAFVFVLSFFVINEYVMINEYSSDIAKLKNELTELSEEKDFYTSELEKKNNMLEIEEKASGALGMIASAEVEKEYITIKGEDSIEVYEPTENRSDSLAAIVMSALGENLVSAWNTLTGAN